MEQFDDRRRGSLAAAAAAVFLVLAGPAHAAGSVVEVTLWDKGADSVADVGHGMAMDGSTAEQAGPGPAWASRRRPRW